MNLLLCTCYSCCHIAESKERMDYFLGTWILDDKGEILYWGHANSTGILFLPKQVYDERGSGLQEWQTPFCISGIVLGIEVRVSSSCWKDYEHVLWHHLFSCGFEIKLYDSSWIVVYFGGVWSFCDFKSLSCLGFVYTLD